MQLDTAKKITKTNLLKEEGFGNKNDFIEKKNENFLFQQKKNPNFSKKNFQDSFLLLYLYYPNIEAKASVFHTSYWLTEQLNKKFKKNSGSSGYEITEYALFNKVYSISCRESQG